MPTVVSQQVELIVEIATDRWFAAGTRVGLVEVEGALVLRRKLFATNLTRRIRGQTWTLQQWSITIHPQRTGTLQVPAVSVALAIAGDDGAVIRGSTSTLPVTFEAIIPAELTGLTSWVATSRLQVEESFDGSLDKLVPGDAFIRRLKLEADNLPALMLPALIPQAIPGLGVYPQQPRLEDINQRGVVRGRRHDQVTYIVEQEGRYEIPGQVVYWWDTSLGVVQKHTIAAFVFQTAGYEAAVVGSAAVEPNREISTPEYNHPLMWIVAGLLFLLLAYWVRRRRQLQDANSTQVSTAELRRKLARHCRRGETGSALAVLYRLLDELNMQGAPIRLRPLLAELDDAQLEADVAGMLAVYYGAGTTPKPGAINFRRLFDKAGPRSTTATQQAMDFNLN
jgi:hypothetical protein